MKFNKKISACLSLALFLSLGLSVKANAQPWYQVSFSATYSSHAITNGRWSFDDGAARFGVNNLANSNKGRYEIWYVNTWSPDTRVDLWENVTSSYQRDALSVISGHGYYFDIRPEGTMYNPISGYVYAGNPVIYA